MLTFALLNKSGFYSNETISENAYKSQYTFDDIINYCPIIGLDSRIFNGSRRYRKLLAGWYLQPFFAIVSFAYCQYPEYGNHSFQCVSLSSDQQ